MEYYLDQALLLAHDWRRLRNPRPRRHGLLPRNPNSLASLALLDGVSAREPFRGHRAEACGLIYGFDLLYEPRFFRLLRLSRHYHSRLLSLACFNHSRIFITTTKHLNPITNTKQKDVGRPIVFLSVIISWCTIADIKITLPDSR